MRITIHSDLPLLSVYPPAGSERWFEELAELADGDDAGFARACERYGIRFSDDESLAARLRRDFDLK